MTAIENRYQAFVRMTPDMLHLISRDGRFLDTHVGKVPTVVPPSQYVGKTIKDIFGDTFSNEAMNYILGALETGEILVWEYTLGQFPDSVFEARFSASGDDEVIVIIRDISEQKKTQKKLEAAVHERTKQLEASNRALQSFAYAASHDLREPLTKIKGFGKILMEKHSDNLDPRGYEYLQVMLSATERMAHLIDNLLSFARAGYTDSPLMVVDLGRVLHEALADLELRVHEAGADVIVGDLPTVHAHSMQIRQVFFNLLSNALKFRHPERPLVIKILGTVEADNAVVIVQDNGIGFDQKDANKIFEVFTRLHTRFDYPGTGIGLALCRRLLEQYGATIEAYGEPGIGAAFTIRIPLTPESHDD